MSFEQHDRNEFSFSGLCSRHIGHGSRSKGSSSWIKTGFGGSRGGGACVGGGAGGGAGRRRGAAEQAGACRLRSATWQLRAQ